MTHPLSVNLCGVFQVNVPVKHCNSQKCQHESSGQNQLSISLYAVLLFLSAGLTCCLSHSIFASEHSQFLVSVPVNLRKKKKKTMGKESGHSCVY